MPLLEQIPLHRTTIFNFDDVPYAQSHKYIKSYHHIISDFLPYHTHDFYEINIIFSGVGMHKLENKDILTQQGDIFIIPPHTKHGYSCHKDLVIFHILLSNSFINAFSPLLEEMQGFHMSFNLEPMFRNYFEKPYYLKAGDIPFEQIENHIRSITTCEKIEQNEAATIAHVLSLIASISNTIYHLKPIHIEAAQNIPMASILESMAFIEKHFDEKIDFKKLAGQCALSYSTFLRCFKNISGITPLKYQTKCKIKQAAKLLLNTDDTVLSIGITCGFYDSSHFIREFIKEKQISPTDFRKERSLNHNF